MSFNQTTLFTTLSSGCETPQLILNIIQHYLGSGRGHPFAQQTWNRSSWGIPGEICNLPNKFLVCPRVSSQSDVPWKPPKGGTQEASWSDDQTTSTVSIRQLWTRTQNLSSFDSGRSSHPSWTLNTFLVPFVLKKKQRFSGYSHLLIVRYWISSWE